MPPEGEQRCHGVCNAGGSASDKRIVILSPVLTSGPWPQALAPPGPSPLRAQTNSEVRLLEKDGRYIFSYHEEIQSHIPSYKIQGDGLSATTLVVDAFAREAYRNVATDWEQANSPLCVFNHSYQPVVDEANQVLAYLRVVWMTGVAHALLTSIEGQLFSDVTIAEKGLEPDIVGNELVATLATLGGSLLVRSLARAAIVSGSSFLPIAMAEGAIDAARGITGLALRMAILGLRGIRGRALVLMFRARGWKVIANVGGEANPMELQAGIPEIAVNPAPRVITPVPNLIKEGGENIGYLFSKETLDFITSRNLERIADIQSLAQGAAKVLKKGGKLGMGFHPAMVDQEYMNAFAQQLLKAGFQRAQPIGSFMDAVK